MKTPKLIAIFLAAFAITSYAATADELKTAIEAYGLSAEIQMGMAGTAVIVTGTATNKTNGLSLDIDQLLNVYWKASLSGNIPAAGPAVPIVPFAGYTNCLLSISGSGNFTVQEGGKIELTGSGYGLCNNGKASISKGGEILAPVGGIAVSNYSTMGIGGKVSVSGLNGLAVYNTGNLMIQGSAEILAIGRGNLAIRSNESGTVSMSHGIVFGYGATDANIIDGAYSQQGGGTNVIIAWNNPIGNPTYTTGTSDNIFKLPAAATAVWSNKDGKAGIDYAYTNPSNNNENKGFIAINGVTVNNPSSSSSSIIGSSSSRETSSSSRTTSSSSIVSSSSRATSSSSRTTSSSSSVQILSSSSNDDPTPIHLINNSMLQNLPAGTKIEVYNLQGKRIYRVQTKGIYIIKQTSPANTHSQYFRLEI